MKKVRGVGVNDADYVVHPQKNGVRTGDCPFYNAWTRMLDRCYSVAYHVRFPTYKGCTVDVRWHRFMAFRAWMSKQDWEGKHLDKDILTPGNKVYSPEACCFVPQHINSLLVRPSKRRESLPIGVYLRPGGYLSAANLNGYRHLGLFPTIEQAEKAYRVVRVQQIRTAAKQVPAGRIRDAILRAAEDVEHGGEVVT